MFHHEFCRLGRDRGIKKSTDFLDLLQEVTKSVYIIGNESMLIAHDINRLRFSHNYSF